jgi:hypothetical protein
MKFLNKLLGRVVSTNLDEVPAEDREKALQLITEKTDIPTFTGTVEHGYSLAKVANPAKCPRCAAPTEWRYTDFIYATQSKPRVMRAPAGRFCTRCPTVVVDENLLQRGASQGFVYRGVLGVETDHPQMFTTWNGKEAIIIIDEETEGMELATRDEFGGFYGGSQVSGKSPASKHKAQKAAQRRKMAKDSRKRNRR